MVLLSCQRTHALCRSIGEVIHVCNSSQGCKVFQSFYVEGRSRQSRSFKFSKSVILKTNTKSIKIKGAKFYKVSNSKFQVVNVKVMP